MATRIPSGGPPPSTLAAQLVGNISGTAKSFGSGEDREVESLLHTIQKIKDDPTALKTQDDRVEYNHLLLYVACRLWLEDVSLDDTLQNNPKPPAMILELMDGFRFHIGETPSLLLYAKKDHQLLARGPEPLWLWLFPQLLRFLGHRQFLDLSAPIENFFAYVLLVVANNFALWEALPKILEYFQSISTVLFTQLQMRESKPNALDPPLLLNLPTQDTLTSISGNAKLVLSPKLTYRVDRASQGLRQVRVLSKILAVPFSKDDSAFNAIPSIAPFLPWLLDFWVDFVEVENRYARHLSHSGLEILQTALEALKFARSNSFAADFLEKKATTALMLLCKEMVGHSDMVTSGSVGDATRVAYSIALIWITHIALKAPAIGRLGLTQLVEETSLLEFEDHTVSSVSDLYACIQIFQHSIEVDCAAPEQYQELPTLQNDQISCLVGQLLPVLRNTSCLSAAFNEQKAREPHISPADLLSRRICEIFGSEVVPDANRLVPTTDFLAGFAKASIEQKCLALDLLSRAGCMAMCTEILLSETPLDPLFIKCAICDGDIASPGDIELTSLLQDACSIFVELVRSGELSECKRSRVTAMISVRRLLQHSNQNDFLDLEVSGAGRWCLQSLNSSVRELRMAAGRTLKVFLQSSYNLGPELNVFNKNMTNSIAFLRTLSDKNQEYLVESCISAWGQVGQIAREDELNLVLIKLVEYLGSHNNLASSFAFNEILRLGEGRGLSPSGLLEPYWGKGLAYLTTKNMYSNPQASRAVAELLQLDVNSLLLQIQSHALPWLVLDNSKAVIQKIAEARKEKEIWRPLTDSNNLATIFSILLMKDPNSDGAFAKQKLDDISPHFHHPVTIRSLLEQEPVAISLELLKAASDDDHTRHSEALHALETVAKLLTDQPAKKKGSIVGRFLEGRVLNIMILLTDTLNDTAANSPPMLEQRRCIGAMKEMIKICGPYARIARPQISAYLLAAFAQPSLRDCAFSCWAMMVQEFDLDDVESLLETTMAAISQYWDSLNMSTKAAMKNMLQTTFSPSRVGSFSESLYHKLPSLSHIKDLAHFSRELDSRLPKLLYGERLAFFAERLKHENSAVVGLALTELIPFLSSDMSSLSTPETGLRSDSIPSILMRSLLDCVSKYSTLDLDIARMCTECMGLIGCPDFNQIETVREQRSFVVLHNFQDVWENVEFVMFLISEVLVPSFLSATATDTTLQGFLAYAMQELLASTGISGSVANPSMEDDRYRLWVGVPAAIREVVTPFLTSRYTVNPMPPGDTEYPIFRPGMPYKAWLRLLALDLLRKGQNQAANLLFQPLTRVIRIKDVATAGFLLPYLVLHTWIASSCSIEQQEQLVFEILEVLRYQPPIDAPYIQKEDAKTCYQAVFRILDYATRWIQSKRASRPLSADQKDQIARVQRYLDLLPAELVSQRSMSCNEYARALFHLENYTQRMEQQKLKPGDRTRLLDQLQDIYANIDEPDGLEGMSAHLHVFDINQQVMGHKKAGRWAAAQTWYEMQLAKKPDDIDVRIDLLNCLKQAGQHDVLLNHVEAMQTNGEVGQIHRVIPFAVEAAWVTGQWESLQKFVLAWGNRSYLDPNVSIAFVMNDLLQGAAPEILADRIRRIRQQIASEMSQSATASLQAAHEFLLRCHVITDLEMVNSVASEPALRQKTMDLVDRRLEMIGAYSIDKQYVLGVRRATMVLTTPKYADLDVSNLWLQSAKLARKSGSVHQSFSAVLHASQLGDDAATIENAKLLWRDNHHRKAIQMLQGAIERNKFMTQTNTTSSSGVGSNKMNKQQRFLAARAQLLLAKWLDAAGQTHAGALREKYQQPPKIYPSWEKGHYYLGRHYKKVLEAEKTLKVDDQSDNYFTGEIARLVIENYMRSLNAGTKYLYQTLPRVLTLWLDLGAQLDKGPDGKAALSRELHRRRIEQLQQLHIFLDKYIDRIPAYMFYTGLAQIVARIAHPNASVFDRLAKIICKVVVAHPRQALWSLIGIVTTKVQSERKSRGTTILNMLGNVNSRVEGGTEDLRTLLRSGEKLAEQLLWACQNGDFHGTKTTKASLKRDLRFQHKCAPCGLAVPVESELTGTLPTKVADVKKHQAFARDVVTIHSFLDEVLVLSSLARPRRLTARGSDGKSYMLLIKPKDDLRTDQRLMEFNSMINRSLKRDAESSRRQLYIRTYAVVPLNEECGVIEWVPGIKTLRDILLNLYSSQKIQPDYMMLKQLMDEASRGEGKVRIFIDDVLGRFPSVLPMWFTHQFPNPSAWFAARLRYTRSCAVMSMVGTILGLGDRHGENVNLEEGTGGIFHVDFNCLFDKGLTFAKPEKVPFRLTHNMVAAMGIYGYEGPFRKSSELTLSILRQQEETLMSILEAFIYDPTLDLQKDKKATRRADGGVKLQPQSVVESIKRKVKGLLPNESIPLGVEGQVEELIKQAVDPRNLTAMYIGWCPFL